MSREVELAERLERVRERIAAAAPTQSPAPTLIVVTKFFPADDVRSLAQLGVRDLGENRDQEAAAKVVQVAQELGTATRAEQLRWHFIGQLQSNKAKSVVRYAHAVHSVDRASLVAALNNAMEAEQQASREADRPQRDRLKCFVQVDLGSALGPSGTEPDPARAQPARGGANPSQVQELALKIEQAEHLELAGVMAVAPLGADPDQAFSVLAGISERLQRTHPSASAISAGMSADLEHALRHGATHLRVGSDVLGERPGLR